MTTKAQRRQVLKAEDYQLLEEMGSEWEQLALERDEKLELLQDLERRAGVREAQPRRRSPSMSSHLGDEQCLPF